MSGCCVTAAAPGPAVPGAPTPQKSPPPPGLPLPFPQKWGPRHMPPPPPEPQMHPVVPGVACQSSPPAPRWRDPQAVPPQPRSPSCAAEKQETKKSCVAGGWCDGGGGTPLTLGCWGAREAPPIILGTAGCLGGRVGGQGSRSPPKPRSCSPDPAVPSAQAQPPVSERGGLSVAAPAGSEGKRGWGSTGAWTQGPPDPDPPPVTSGRRRREPAATGQSPRRWQRPPSPRAGRGCGGVQHLAGLRHRPPGTPRAPQPGGPGHPQR